MMFGSETNARKYRKISEIKLTNNYYFQILTTFKYFLISKVTLRYKVYKKCNKHTISFNSRLAHKESITTQTTLGSITSETVSAPAIELSDVTCQVDVDVFEGIIYAGG